jgi:hypothetical protein
MANSSIESWLSRKSRPFGFSVIDRKGGTLGGVPIILAFDRDPF